MAEQRVQRDDDSRPTTGRGPDAEEILHLCKAPEIGSFPSSSRDASLLAAALTPPIAPMDSPFLTVFREEAAPCRNGRTSIHANAGAAQLLSVDTSSISTPDSPPLGCYPHSRYEMEATSLQWAPTSPFGGTNCRSGLDLGGSGADYGGTASASTPSVQTSSSCPRGSITMTAANTSATSYGHRRPYVGEEIELLEEEDGTHVELDDYALASTHSAKHAPRKQFLGDASSPFSDAHFVDPTAQPRPCREEDEGGREHRDKPHWRRPSLAKIPLSPAVLVANLNDQQRRAACPLSKDEALEQVYDFVSFRRPGLSECIVCQTGLPYGSNFCSNCGTPTDGTLLVTPKDFANSLVGGCPTGHKNSWTLTGTGVDGGGSPVLSSCLASPDGARDDEVGLRQSFSRFSLTPIVSDAAVSPRDSPSLRRKVYRRQVKFTSRYKKKSFLGSGSSGAVFKAIDVRSGQQLAVKEILMDPRDEVVVASIRNELRHLSNLRHQNIIEYLGCYIKEMGRHEKLPTFAGGDGADTLVTMDNGLVTASPAANAAEDGSSESEAAELKIRVFILMERMEGGTLECLLDEFPDGMPECAVRNYVSQILDAVSYLHSRNLTHRDIKPSNILLTSDGVAKLSDFGCAVVTVASQELADSTTTATQVAGTPAYMPPEALSIGGKTGADLALHYMAHDTWAIGCVTHQLLTGQVPWAFVPRSTPISLSLYLQNSLGATETFPIDTEQLSPVAQNFCSLCFERDALRRATAASLLQHPFITGKQP